MRAALALLTAICVLTPALAQAKHHGKHRRPAGSTYVVADESSLSEVAVRLFGDEAYWPRIARWNHLRRPYVIWKGRKLRLRKAPTLTPEQGDRALLNYWRRYFGLEGEPALPQTAPERKSGAAPVDVSLLKRFESAPDADEGDLDDSQLEARGLLAEGERSFRDKNYAAALERFRASRELDPDSLSSWFYEIRSLKLLGREAEAGASAEALLKRKPELKALPMFRPMFPTQEKAE